MNDVVILFKLNDVCQYHTHINCMYSIVNSNYYIFYEIGICWCVGYKTVCDICASQSSTLGAIDYKSSIHISYKIRRNYCHLS